MSKEQLVQQHLRMAELHRQCMEDNKRKAQELCEHTPGYHEAIANEKWLERCEICKKSAVQTTAL